jgi:ABC-type nitrate/sulfonate/bicarbonate transport system permease component
MPRSFAKLVPGIISFLAIGLLWEGASSLGMTNKALLPPPSVILPTLWGIVATGAVVKPLTETLQLLFAGFGIATVLGILVGIGMGWSDRIYYLFDPLVELIRPIPKAALVPPLFLFLGLGATMKITTVALAAFFPVLISTIQGVRGVDPVAVNTARTFGCPTWRLLLNVVLPASLPLIFTGMRVSLGLGLILVVLAEMLAGQGGLGYLIVDMQRSFAIRQMYAWIFILAVLGLALNALFEFIEARTIPWRGK